VNASSFGCVVNASSRGCVSFNCVIFCFCTLPRRDGSPQGVVFGRPYCIVTLKYACNMGEIHILPICVII